MMDLEEYLYDFSSAQDPHGVALRDLKTSGKGPPKDAIEAKHWIQMTSYAFGKHVLDGVMPERVQVDYLVDLHRGIEHRPVVGTVNDFDLAALFNRLENIAHALKAGVFAPAPRDHWTCSEKWCGYWHTCPYVQMPAFALWTCPSQTCIRLQRHLKGQNPMAQTSKRTPSVRTKSSPPNLAAPASFLSNEDRNWIQQTTSAILERQLQAHEKACTEEMGVQIEERLRDLPASRASAPVLKFNEKDKKAILNLILNEARNNATKYDDDAGKKVFSEFKYEEQIPTDEELDRFLFVCEQKALDPRANQIYFQKRAGTRVFLVAIDSYRLQAERSGHYRASAKPTEYFDQNHKPYYGDAPHHCVTYCWKQDDTGAWFEIAQIAFFDEYKQTYRGGKLNDMWARMGRSQLEKC